MTKTWYIYIVFVCRMSFIHVNIIANKNEQKKCRWLNSVLLLAFQSSVMEKEALSCPPLSKLDVELGKYILTRGHAWRGKTHPWQKKNIEFHGVWLSGLVPQEWKEEGERAIVLQKGINTRELKWGGIHCERRYNDKGQESALRWRVNSWGGLTGS